MKKLILFCILTCFILYSINPVAQATSGPITKAPSDLLVNITTGEVYYEQNADEPRAPASLTKLMTVYMVYQAIERGDITKETLVYISKHTQDISLDPEGSNVPLYCGEYYSVDELLHAAMTVSANGAACALGELLSGSESSFAKEMTHYANRQGWDMTFYDASGLDDRNCITARSLSYLATALINKYPDILTYSACTSICFGGITYKSTNLLLPDRGYTYDGTDGLKTGTTNLAGRCLISTTERNGNRLLAIVLGASSNDVRYNDAINMMDYGFSRALSLRLSNQEFFLNNNKIRLTSYIADGKNYVRLRDLAKAFIGTVNEYSVSWDAATKTISLVIGEPEDSGNTLDCPPKVVGAKRSNDYIQLNDTSIDLCGYIIRGEHYYSIRDLATLLGINIVYDSIASAINMTSDIIEAEASVTTDEPASDEQTDIPSSEIPSSNTESTADDVAA